MVPRKENQKNHEKEKVMADKNVTQDDFVTVSEGTAEPEIKIVFDTIGDSFTGTYLGSRTMDNQDGSYIQYRFEKDNEIYFVNANYNLRQGFKTVRAGSKVRITYTDDLDTGQASPMRCFKVEVARKTTANRATST
jgi:hypothetical protein